MKEIILRWTKWVREEIDEETGEIKVEGHTEMRHERFNLNEILEMKTSWNGVSITFLDGTTFETDDNDIHIFYH